MGVNFKELKVGDYIYEYEYGYFIKSEVMTQPLREAKDDDVYWSWEGKNVLGGAVIKYSVSEKYSHFF